MSATTATTALGEGLIEVEYPKDLMDATQYAWTDVVAVNPSEEYGRCDIQFPAEFEGTDGTLVVVVTHPPRATFGFIDKLARAGNATPEQGTEIVLGRGPVRLRERFAGGRSTRRERTAVGVGDALDAEAVRSVHGLWGRLELRR
jgi:hypothetical protein